jgi:hypothetical protein
MHWALHETDFKPNEQAGVSLVTKTADSFRRFFDVYSNIMRPLTTVALCL